MARVLLAPVLDQHLLGAGHDVAGRLEAREPAADDAAVAVAPGGVGHGSESTPGVPQRGAVPPIGRVVGVEDVDVRVGREVGVERDAEQAAVPEVVDVRAQVGEDGRRRVGEVVEDLDQAALLGDEDPAVGGEANGGRVGQAAEDDRLLEAAAGALAGRAVPDARARGPSA